VPLYTESFPEGLREERSRLAVAYLKRNYRPAEFPGGLPTSFNRTGQQWDLPNGWPPLEHMVVKGLEKTDLPEAKELAFAIAERRVKGSFVNFKAKGHMFEKVPSPQFLRHSPFLLQYDCTEVAKIGGGGEYEVQVGFGWSNGTVLDFLDMYRDRLKWDDDGVCSTSERRESEDYSSHNEGGDAVQSSGEAGAGMCGLAAAWMPASKSYTRLQTENAFSY